MTILSTTPGTLGRVRTGGWMAVGGAAAIMTGSTPIGVVLVAGVAGALAWRSATGHSRTRR